MNPLVLIALALALQGTLSKPLNKLPDGVGPALRHMLYLTEDQPELLRLRPELTSHVHLLVTVPEAGKAPQLVGYLYHAPSSAQEWNRSWVQLAGDDQRSAFKNAFAYQIAGSHADAYGLLHAHDLVVNGQKVQTLSTIYFERTPSASVALMYYSDRHDTLQVAACERKGEFCGK